MNIKVPPVMAQGTLTDTLNPLQADTNGVHLYSVSAYDGYYSSPQAYTGARSSGNLKPDMGFGAGATVGWNFLRSGSGISVVYSPSYNAFQRYSNLNAFNHAFSLTIHNKRDPGRKWHTDISTDANASTTTQFLFAPTTLGRLADVPATFDELAQGVVAGRYTNDQIAALLTGAAMPQSASEIALFGDYYLSAAVQGRVSYAHSSRLTVSMAVSGRRFEALPRSDSAMKSTYLLPSSTTGTGGIQVAYALSPRTQLEFDVTSTRTFSRLQDSYNNAMTTSLSRVMSRRWFLEGRVGADSIIPLRQSAPVQRRPQMIGGGGIGFKTDTHTFMVQSSLSHSDPYGLGSHSNASATAAWSWRPRSSGWSFLTDVSWQRLNGGVLSLSDSWHGQSRVNRSLTRQTGVALAFGYLSNSGLITSAVANRSLRSLVLSVYWMPGGEKPPSIRQ